MTTALYDYAHARASLNVGAMQWLGNMRRLAQESCLSLEVRLAERAYSDAIHDITASLLMGQGRGA